MRFYVYVLLGFALGGGLAAAFIVGDLLIRIFREGQAIVQEPNLVLLINEIVLISLVIGCLIWLVYRIAKGGLR